VDEAMGWTLIWMGREKFILNFGAEILFDEDGVNMDLAHVQCHVHVSES
jgi:hypothetical protein